MLIHCCAKQPRVSGWEVIFILVVEVHLPVLK